jgi:DNA-binding CsgD family transcriptional regulator
MYTEDAMLKLVDLVYATACDPSKWESFLQALSDAVGGSGADILTMTSGDRPAVHVQIGVGIVGPELRREYRVAGARDPFMLAAKRVGFFRTGAIGIGEAFVPTSQLLRSEFYNDVGKRFDYVGGLSAVIAINPKVTSAISVCRHPNASFGEPDVALIRALMPHLQRAVQVHTRLAEADAREGALCEMLNRIATGAALVDSDGNVLFLNESARIAVAEGDGLALDHGRLCTARYRETLILQNLIAGASRTTDGEGSHPGGILLVERPSGKRSFQVVVSPMSTSNMEVLAPPLARAIVFIVNPDHAPEPDGVLIRRFYGFSRAEADVALLLLHDRTAQEIADLLCVSINTVRFHIKHMLSKAGARRQSELVRLLLETSQLRQPPACQDSTISLRPGMP